MSADKAWRARVLLVTTVPITIEAFLLPLVHRLSREGWEVDGMAHRLPEAAASTEFHHAWDAPWTRSPFRSLLHAPRAIGTVRSIVTSRPYALVHVQTPIAAFLTRLAVATLPRSERPSVIYTAHGFHFHPAGSWIWNGIALTLERLAAPWTAVLVVTNADDMRSALRHRLLPAARVLHIPGVGIDTEHFRAERVPRTAVDSVFRELGLPVGTPLVVCIGELNRNKNQSLLIEALAKMRRTDVHLVLRGDGTEHQRLVDLAGARGVRERLHVLEFRPDLRPLVRAAAVFALVSRREGLPRVMMEALSLEIPVVGTDTRGIRDLLADGVGTLVQPDDVSALARALDRIIADPAATDSATRRGRTLIQERYGLNRVLDMHLAMYRRALRQAASEPDTSPERRDL